MEQPFIQTSYEYKGCTVESDHDPKGVYFGISPENEGYQTQFVKVTFPDNTWIRCANPSEAEKYIDLHLIDPHRL